METSFSFGGQARSRFKCFLCVKTVTSCPVFNLTDTYFDLLQMFITLTYNALFIKIEKSIMKNIIPKMHIFVYKQSKKMSQNFL